MDQAEVWVGITAGGAGLEDFLRSQFGRVVVVILDFYHAAEHLAEWAKAMHPDDPPATADLAAVWCHRLKHEGGAVVLSELTAWDVTGRPAAREAHRQLVGYVTNQCHRMDYPSYRAQGWQIGSGNRSPRERLRRSFPWSPCLSSMVRRRRGR
jgi:hypothetical protein